jgi:integrase
MATSLKPSTLSRQLAAISHAHTANGLASPTKAALVRSTMRGIKRTHGSKQKQAKPISISMLHKVVNRLPALCRLRNSRDRALLLLGFAGGFRRSELASLRMGDITLTRQGALVRLRSAKTDQLGKGRDVAIPYAKSSACPVKALKEWIKAMHAQTTCCRDVNPPLFTSIDRHGHIRSGLNAASIGWILLRRMRAAGLDTAGFSAHSLRAGLVTSAAKAGVPTWAIQQQTGHRSEEMVKRYIRDLDAFACNATAGLL